MNLNQFLLNNEGCFFEAPNRLFLSCDRINRQTAFNLTDYTVQSSLSGNQLFIVPKSERFAPVVVSDLQEGDFFRLAPEQELTMLRLEIRPGHYIGKYQSENFTITDLKAHDIVFIHPAK